jgi:hypothetical protein
MCAAERVPSNHSAEDASRAQMRMPSRARARRVAFIVRGGYGTALSHACDSGAERSDPRASSNAAAVAPRVPTTAIASVRSCFCTLVRERATESYKTLHKGPQGFNMIQSYRHFRVY